MVVVDKGLELIRDFLAGSSPNPPKGIFFGGSTTSVNKTDSSMSEVIYAKSFLSTDSSVVRQVQWESVLSSAEANNTSINQIALYDTASFFTAINSADTTSGWNTDSNTEISIQTGSAYYVEGTASLNINKTGTSSITASINTTFSAQDFTDKSLYFWFYITSSSSLNNLASSSALRIRLGSDTSGATDYWEWTKDRSDLTTGWNNVSDLITSGATSSGSPSVTSTSYFSIALEMTASSVTNSSGTYLLDDIKFGDTNGNPYIIEDINTISKNNQFDLQTLIIAETIRGGDV